MNTSRGTLLYISLFFLLLFHPVEGRERIQTIDALLLIDSRNNLSHSVRKDEKMMQSLLQSIADATHMQLNLKVIEGDQAYSSNLQNWLDSLKNDKPHDVILFYFTGHGCKNPSNLIPWPNLFLSGKSGSLVSMGSIIKVIEALPSRLSLVLADCCNGALLNKSYIGIQAVHERVRHKKETYTFGAGLLFKSSHGHIRATASVPGQPALAFSTGSLFTLALHESLTKNCKSTTPSWERVFHSATTLCGSYQKPYISLDLK